MIFATITGNITKDAATRQAGQSTVTSFGIASNRKVKGQDETTFVDASVWGDRGEKLGAYLTKGTKVTVVGELSTRDYNGKTYLQVRVAELDFGGSKGTKRSETKQDNSDDLPF